MAGTLWFKTCEIYLPYTLSQDTRHLLYHRVPAIPKTHQLKGVRADSRNGKQICILTEDQKCTIEPSVPYSIELKPMHKVRGMW